MTGWKEKINAFIDTKKGQIQKSKKISEQKRAEKLRKKIKNIQDAKPGAVKAIRSGLMTNAKPLEVMRREYDRRKYERDHK